MAEVKTQGNMDDLDFMNRPPERFWDARSATTSGLRLHTSTEAFHRESDHRRDRER